LGEAKMCSPFQYIKSKRQIAIVWTVIVFGITQIPVFAQNISPIALSWLGGNPPSLSAGVSWGVPLPEGRLMPTAGFSLKDSRGQALPVQSWPLAYWPDGSLKWDG